MEPDPKLWGGITESEYVALPSRFNPVHFDADALVRLAKATGQRYMVFTTKHHDGFCMFNSSYTSYKITNTPYQKDIVAQLAEACRRENMPLGFYYSPPDMHHPDYRDPSKLVKDSWRGDPTRPEWPTYLNYMELQLRELLTRYGPVAIIWFDGLDHEEKYDGYRFLKMIHELSPDTLVNNRIGLPADYETPEQFVPQTIPVKAGAPKPAQGEVPRPEDFRPWETCMTINNTWAYNNRDRQFKSAQVLIRTLISVASKGGAGWHHSAGVPGAAAGGRRMDEGQWRFDLRYNLRPVAKAGVRQEHRKGEDDLPARVRLAVIQRTEDRGSARESQVSDPTCRQAASAVPPERRSTHH
jgi:alpha-L-fucosidase